MARGVNRVIIVGNLARDPEVRYTASGTAVANFPVATNETWKDRNGERQEKAEFHRIVAWSRLAEVCGEYLRKGSKTYIEGRLQTRKWQDQNGQDRYTTEIVANEMQMLDSRGGGAAPAGGESAAQAAPQSSGGGEQPAEAPADFDDDIPFAWLAPVASALMGAATTGGSIPGIA